MVLIDEVQEERSQPDDDHELSVVVIVKKPRRPPHNYVSIVKDAVRPFNTSSPEEICRQLHGGVLLREQKQMYWVDQESNKNCFTVLARGLTIIWGDDPRYWKRVPYKESADEEEIEVAVLVGLCWLEICGKFRTITLAPGTVYEAVFVVMMLDSYCTWDSPVKLSATLPNGKKVESEHYLWRYPKKEWVDIPIGEFNMSPENVGEVAFSLDEHGKNWKMGMAVKGVTFRPKK